MDKFKEKILQTEHIKNAVSSHPNDLDDYMLSEQEKLSKLLLDLMKANEKYRTVMANLALIKDEEEILYSDVHELFAIIYGYVRTTAKDLLTTYFKNMAPYNARKLKDVRRALNSALIIVKNPDYKNLDDFQSKIELALEKIEQFLPKQVELLSQKDDAKVKYDDALKLWNTQYKRLKSYFKGFFMDSDINYKDYFLDLGKKRKAKVKKDLDETKEDVKNPTEESNSNNIDNDNSGKIE